MKFGVIYDIEGDPIIDSDRPPQAQLEAKLWEQDRRRESLRNTTAGSKRSGAACSKTTSFGNF